NSFISRNRSSLFFPITLCYISIPLRRKSKYIPLCIILFVTDAVVHTSAAPLPKLNAVRNQPVAAPKVGQRYLFTFKLFLYPDKVCFQLLARGHFRALPRGPRSQLAQPGPVMEVIF